MQHARAGRCPARPDRFAHRAIGHSRLTFYDGPPFLRRDRFAFPFFSAAGNGSATVHRKRSPDSPRASGRLSKGDLPAPLPNERARDYLVNRSIKTLSATGTIIPRRMRVNGAAGAGKGKRKRKKMEKERERGRGRRKEGGRTRGSSSLARERERKDIDLRRRRRKSARELPEV